MLRRQFLSHLGIGLFAISLGRVGFGQQSNDGIQIELKEMLEKGLKARLDSEFKFIAFVVDLVDEKVLTLKLVQETFLYARRKPKHPMRYFRFGMITRANRVGVDLEKLMDQRGLSTR